MSAVRSPEEPLLAAPAAPSRTQRMSGVVLPALGLYLLTALFYGWMGHRQPIPIVAPDEFLYGHLAQSLAAGDGFQWRGQHIDFTSALYVYAIAPAWLVASGETAYEIAKAAGAAMAALAVIPAFLLGRALLGPRLGALAAVLAVSGTWMAFTAGILTENLAYPLGVACLAATVFALRAPGGRAGLLAVAFAVLGAWSRTQLVVLLPAILAAVAIDTAWGGAAWRERLRAHRTTLLAAGGTLAVVGLALLVLGRSSLGFYSSVYSYTPDLATVLARIGQQLLATVTMAGFVPFLLALGLALSPRAWRDRETGPLLAVLWPATLILGVTGGYYQASLPAENGVEAYMAYLMPLGLLLTLAAFRRRELLTPRVLAVTVAGGLVLLLSPDLRTTGQERAMYGTAVRLGDLLGSSVPVTLAVAAVVLGLLAVAAVRSPWLRGRFAGPAVAVGAGLLLVFAVQSQATWSWQRELTQSWRSELPKDLAWVDHHSGGPVASLVASSINPRFHDVDFFNGSVEQVYLLPQEIGGNGLQGRTCVWQVAERGALSLDPECGATPHRFLLQDPGAAITFHGERELGRDPDYGRLVAVPGDPRVRSVLQLPCNAPVVTFRTKYFDAVPAATPRPCRGALNANLWLDFPATVALTFRGGSVEHRAAIGKRTWRLPAREPTTIRVPVAQGAAVFQLDLDWRSSRGAPELVGARLEGPGGSSALL